jgi:hypothetical protein
MTETILNTRFNRIGRLIQAAAVASILFATTTVMANSPASTFDIFLAPGGNDAAEGRSRGQPVKTLDRVHAILEKEKPAADVRVLIAPGTYRGQEVRWTYVNHDFQIRFEPLDRRGGRPVFDGCSKEGGRAGQCGGATWFILAHQSGKPTNLVFDSLRIQNYQTAISFNGNRNAIHTSNGRNIIRNCYFYRIGDISDPENIRPSTAAVRLVNSKENIIENNDFIDIINVNRGGLLHAIYLAHHADSNRIDNNRFINHSGDAVRVRDFSNGNVITRNRFEKAGTGGAYSEWYCDHDARSDCTKATPECPSWENVFRDNLIGTNFDGQALPEFVFYQGDSTSGCEKPAPDAQRLISSGNRRIKK